MEDCDEMVTTQVAEEGSRQGKITMKTSTSSKSTGLKRQSNTKYLKTAFNFCLYSIKVIMTLIMIGLLGFIFLVEIKVEMAAYSLSLNKLADCLHWVDCCSFCSERADCWFPCDQRRSFSVGLYLISICIFTASLVIVISILIIVVFYSFLSVVSQMGQIWRKQMDTIRMLLAQVSRLLLISIFVAICHMFLWISYRYARSRYAGEQHAGFLVVLGVLLVPTRLLITIKLLLKVNNFIVINKADVALGIISFTSILCCFSFSLLIFLFPFLFNYWYTTYINIIIFLVSIVVYLLPKYIISPTELLITPDPFFSSFIVFYFILVSHLWPFYKITQSVICTCGFFVTGMLCRGNSVGTFTTFTTTVVLYRVHHVYQICTLQKKLCSYDILVIGMLLNFGGFVTTVVLMVYIECCPW